MRFFRYIAKMDKTITVYGLTASDGEIRYIGQTTQPAQRRLAQHISYARKQKRTSVHKWISSRLLVNDDIHIVVLAMNAVWHETEMEVISFHRSMGSRLLNLTDGGEGTLGFHHSGRKRPDLAERNKANTGKPGRQRLPGETEKLMSYVRGSKRPWVSERNRLLAGKPGHKHTEDHKKKVGDRFRGIPLSIEVVNKQRATKAAWSHERTAEIGLKISRSKKAANSLREEERIARA